MSQGSHHLVLGPKFGPIPNAKKYGFFPIRDKKFPIRRIFFFFGGGGGGGGGEGGRGVLHLYFK